MKEAKMAIKKETGKKATAVEKAPKVSGAAKAVKPAKVTEGTKAAVAKVEKVAEKESKGKVAKVSAKTGAKASKAEAAKTAAQPSVTKSSAAKSAVKKATAAPKAVESKTAAAKSATRKTKAVEKIAAVEKTAKTSAKASSEEISSMAQSFDAEYLVLMQKDPNWMHAFWEISENRVKQAKNGKKKLVLRLFSVANDLTVQRSKKKQKFRDVEVPADARSWYVENTAGEAVVAFLGEVKGKNFMPILQSAPVAVFDKGAAAPAADDAFAKASLGGATLGNFMSSGFSSQTAESWLNSLGANGGFGSSSESMFSGVLSSAALQAMGANAIESSKDSVNYGKDFFLWVKTRLIVYGGTRPDAHLQVRGEDFPLNPDGTFSFEEDLPDVTKVIPVFATDKDGDFPTTIVPIVVKRTE